MVKFINSWAQGIVLAVIIATIIEIILPEGNNKKYVKTIIGIYILFSIVYPLLTKISNKSINIDSIVASTNEEISKYETNTNINLETDSYIENTYKAKIENDIKDKFLEKGYEVNLLNVFIETQDEERYGQINNIEMKIEKLKETKKEEKNNKTASNEINQISKVEINISSNSVEKKENEEDKEISIDEVQTLKEYLNDTYGTEKDKIHINE